MTFISIGGKIIKKANALSNFRDSVVIHGYNNKNENMSSVKYNKKYLRCHYYKNIFTQNCIKINPHLKNNNNRLNLIMPDIQFKKKQFSNSYYTSSN